MVNTPGPIPLESRRDLSPVNLTLCEQPFVRIEEAPKSRGAIAEEGRYD